MANHQAPTIEPQESTPGLLSLGEILVSLADTLGRGQFTLTDPAITAYTVTLGHRTDEDLNKAYRTILRNSRFMPSPAELLDACPVMKIRRDGSRPE
ncbi:MAG TPA: hypothetical protein VGR71_10600 [Nitrospira sp.]|nr:hypothetical protein [Nitrospira sp.]